MYDYRKVTTFEKRRQESIQLAAKYPSRVCIVISHDSSITLPKHKFLVPTEMEVGALMFLVRKKAGVESPAAAFFFFLDNNVLPPSSWTMQTLVGKYRSDDGMTYLTLRRESVFGSTPQVSRVPEEHGMRTPARNERTDPPFPQPLTTQHPGRQ
jgi:hypothetical protein